MFGPPRDHAQARRRQFGALVVVALFLFLLVRLVGSSGGEDPAARASPSASVPPPDPENPLPACRHADTAATRIGYKQWRTTLVDTERRLPRDYQPPDLVSVTDAGFEGPFQVRAVMVEDLRALGEAAAAAGNPVEIEAAFRTFDQQQALFDQRVAELGRDEALEKVARAGHSEHQLGTTIDLKTAGADDVEETWASTPAGAWTVANAHRFGFVLTYPEGQKAETCYGYEPWHYRYFGREKAARIVASGLTPREYLWRESSA